MRGLRLFRAAFLERRQSVDKAGWFVASLAAGGAAAVCGIIRPFSPHTEARRRGVWRLIR
jgi:hypothetical protein